MEQGFPLVATVFWASRAQTARVAGLVPEE